MENSRLYLNDLTTTSKNYTVKIKVVEKTRPKYWPRNRVLYQNLLLVDDKGNKMRGILFGEQIGLYKDALVYRGCYEISNAPIKACHKERPATPADRNRLMVFNRLTVIHSLDAGAEPIYPKYQNICQIPKAARTSDRYDVVGIVLFVEDHPRNITRQHGKTYAVRELAVLDNSTEQPLLITAWNDLASAECELLIPKATKLQMVSFTALKPSDYKGFSMSTTVSTTVIRSPTGEKAQILANWRNLNWTKLTEMQERITNARRSFPNKHKTTIAAMLEKRAYNSNQAEKYILKIRIPETNLDNISAYLGCSECERETNTKGGDIFYCTACLTDNVMSLPRVTTTFAVTDGTGNLPVTAFTTYAEKILQMQANDILAIKKMGNYAAFEPIREQIQASQFTIVVGPATTPSQNNIQQWELQGVENCFNIDTKKTTIENTFKAAEQNKGKLLNDADTPNIRDISYEARSDCSKDAGIHTTNNTMRSESTTLPDNKDHELQPNILNVGNRNLQAQQLTQVKREEVRTTTTDDIAHNAKANKPINQNTTI